MPRNVPYSAEHYRPLVEAITASGLDEWPSGQVAVFVGCSSNNLATRMAWAIENGLFHRVYIGRRTAYRLGPNPASGMPANPVLGDFQACLETNGKLWLYGVPQAEDDSCHILNSPQRRALAEILQGDPSGSWDGAGSVMAFEAPVILAKLWADGELQIFNLPTPNGDGAIVLRNEDRLLLRSLLVRP